MSPSQKTEKQRNKKGHPNKENYKKELKRTQNNVAILRKADQEESDK